MKGLPIEKLIEKLAADARPVVSLAPPFRRAATMLGTVALVGGTAIALMSDMPGLLARYAGREAMLAAEMLAMLATGILAATGAFFLSIPGHSKRWLLAPVLPFIAWVSLSGLGCYELLGRAVAGEELGHSFECLLFILGASLIIGAPMVWLLSRARPVDPMPVALLGGLGTAALAAFLLQFFHPIAVTFLDLAVHLVAIALVIGTLALLNRRALTPA